MAKQPTKKEREAFLQSIQNSIPDDTQAQMADTLTESLELEKELVELSKQDRLIQLGQSVGEYKILEQEKQIAKEEHNIFDDEEEIKKSLSSIDENVKRLANAITKSVGGGINGVMSNAPSHPLVDTASKLIQTSEYANQDKAYEKQDRANRSSATKTLDFFDKTGIVKRGSTGFFSQMYGLPELAKQEEKEKYIEREKEYGSQETDDRLSANFDALQTWQRKKSLAKTEFETKKKRLNLNDEQLAETNTGKELLANIEELDKSIAQLDSSISGRKEGPIQQIPELSPIDKELISRTEPQKDQIAPENNWKEGLAEILATFKPEKDTQNTKQEHELEVERSAEEQKDLLEQIEINTRVKDIPEQPKQEQPQPTQQESNSSGSILDSIGSGGIKQAGQAVLGAGKTALNVGRTLMGGAALPLAGAAVAGYALHKGAEAFADSFGEGGFDVIHALHKQGIIDYNFGDSEILDWKAVEQLPSDVVQKMIDADEFSEEDTKRLEDIIKGNNMTFKPAGQTETDKLYKEKLKDYPEEMQKDVSVQNSVREESSIEAEQNLKERGVHPLDMVNGNGEIQRVGERASAALRNDVQRSTGVDNIIKPTSEKASQVYNQSSENAENSAASASNNNTVVAPTTINNNSTTNQTVRLPVRNEDDTLRRYVSSRYTK